MDFANYKLIMILILIVIKKHFTPSVNTFLQRPPYLNETRFNKTLMPSVISSNI